MMLLNGFEQPITLALKPSRLFVKIRLCAYLAALVALLIPTAIPVYIQALLCGYPLVGLFLTLRQYQRNRHHCRYYYWLRSNVIIETINGDTKVWRWRNGAIVTPWFILFHLYRAKQSYALLIFKDQCTQDIYRRLSVRLKTAATGIEHSLS